MSNAIYQKGKHALGNKEIEFDTDTLTVHLVTGNGPTPGPETGYIFSQSHTSVSANIQPHIATAGGVPYAASVNMTGVNWSTAGILDSIDPTFTLVDGGQTIKGLVIAKGDTPIAYFDTGAGFPFTSSGGNITLQWSASGIFHL